MHRGEELGMFGFTESREFLQVDGKTGQCVLSFGRWLLLCPLSKLLGLSAEGMFSPGVVF